MVPYAFRTRMSCADLSFRDIVCGMDASQMDESLYEAQWAAEIDYHPFASANGNGHVRLE
jgi:hypothetical protein